jgi:hypothetical protein
MLAPMALLAASGNAVPQGWREVARYAPPWWEDPAAETPTTVEGPTAAVRKGGPPRTIQLALFDTDPVPSPASKEPAKPVARDADADAAPSSHPWIGDLTASEVYQNQKSIAGRAVPDDETIQKCIGILAVRGGRITAPALSREMGMPAFRLRGWIASAQRLLNVEGYAILGRDDPSDTITLNIDLLKRQFELDGS